MSGWKQRSPVGRGNILHDKIPSARRLTKSSDSLDGALVALAANENRGIQSQEAQRLGPFEGERVMAGAGGLTVAVSRDNGVLVVELAGELDLATAPTLQDTLNGLDGPVLVDCTHLRFLDGRGLRVIADRARSNGSLILCQVSPSVRRVIGLVGMDDLIALEER